MLVLEKAGALQEEAELMLEGLRSAQFPTSPGMGRCCSTPPGSAGDGRPSATHLGDPGRGGSLGGGMQGRQAVRVEGGRGGTLGEG